MTRRTIACGIAALLLIGASHARDDAHKACMETAGGVTAEMLDCIGGAYTRTDDALNRLWNESLPKQDETTQGALREAQRHWIVSRDSTCFAEGAAWGEGSFATVAVADCRLRLTAERLRWLEIITAPKGQN